MRKLKLLMMTVCALMGAGQTWAQKWVDVTSFYLKNADFEGSYSVQKTFQSGGNNERCVYKPSDWTVTHDNENTNDITILKTGDKQSASFKYFNLKPTDGGDQAYLVRFRWGGQYWDSGQKGSADQITLSQTQTIPSGKYRLSADLVFITAEESPTGHLRIYADKTAGGSLGYVDANIIKGTREGETIKSGSASWALKTTDEFDLDDATETKFAIEFTQTWRWEIQAGADNYRLERKCPDGAYTINVAPSVCSSTDNWSLKSGTFDNGSYAEHWVNDMPTSGDYLKFTLGNVPNGTYKVKVTAKSSNTGSRDSNVTPVSNDGGTNYASIVAGNVEQPIPTWNALDAATGASPQQYTLSNIMVTDGNLVVALKVKETGPNWMIAKIDEIEYQGSYLYDYNSALAAAEAAIANNDYDNITGSERTILQEEIDKDEPTTPDGYVEATAALIEKTSTFITAKSSYDAFAAEKASAIAMGVSSDDADDIRPSSASGLQDALRALYVLEDVATKTNYTIDATTKFGSWTTQNLDTKNDQHWSGTTVTYYDRWQNSGYTSSITSTVTLPAGKYVFKLAARAQTGSINGAFNMSVKVGENAAVYKDFVAKDNSGKGITTSGAVSYSDGEFCNDGAGRGWEWRFIGFELDAEASVTLKGYAQIYGGNWVGFSDATLLTTSDNVAVLKDLLNAEITTARGIDTETNVGDGVFQTPSSAVTALETAIGTAQTVYDNGDATSTEVSDAISSLQTAETTYKNTVNPPAVGKKYYIKVATSGHAKLNKAWLLAAGSTSENNPTGYTIAANNDPASYLAQAFTFTQVRDNIYNISITLPEGEVYLTYGSLNGSPAGWNKQQIQATTNSANKGEFRIYAGSVANTFKIFNTKQNDYIDSQDGGNIYTDTNIEKELFAVDEASQATVNVNIAETVKYGTRIFPFAPTLPSGVTAYSCGEADGAVLTLVEVDEPQANTPYILEAASGCASTDLKGWGTASADTYTTGWLTGVYTSTDAPNGSYVLQNNGGKVGFYQVDTEKATPTVGAYRCYMTVPTTARPAFFFDDETTGIDAINALTSGSATIYSVDGRHLPSLQKGLNIVKTNGKTYKVMVK